MENFLNEGYYGFYTNFYLEVVYLHEKSSGKIFNIFTKVTAFDSETDEHHDIALRYGELNKKFNFGYKASVKAKTWIYSFLSTIPQQNFVDNGISINISNLQKLNRQFVSCVVSKKLNSILKGCYGNYVFEYFDEKKENVDFILEDFVLFERINSELEPLKIDLTEIPERLGNVLVVFPNGLIENTIRKADTDLDITWSKKMKASINGIYLLHRDSETLKDFEVFAFQNNQIIFTERTYQQIFRLIDVDRNLVLLDGHNCKEFLALSMSVSKQLDCLRNFNDGTPSISIGKSPGYSQIGHKLFNIDPIVRKYQAKLKVEKEEKDLIYKQYGIGNSSTSVSERREIAISHLIKLIRENGEKGVCIWDPYMRAEEIIDLIIKNHKFDSKVMILGSNKIYTSGSLISGLDKNETGQTNKDQWFARNKKLLLESSDSCGLNLEFRCAHSSSISSFHDRFLIFPSVGLYNEPKVWSLGISLNQFGHEHHILHQVGFPEYIIKAFNYYWNEFDNEENIVYKTEYDS